MSEIKCTLTASEACDIFAKVHINRVEPHQERPAIAMKAVIDAVVENIRKNAEPLAGTERKPKVGDLVLYRELERFYLTVVDYAGEDGRCSLIVFDSNHLTWLNGVPHGAQHGQWRWLDEVAQ